MNRFDRSCIRAFFTLPANLQKYPGTTSWTEYSRPFNEGLKTANAITKDGVVFYIIWMDDPESISTKSKIDLSFRDFSKEGIVPVVLIRQNKFGQTN